MTERARGWSPHCCSRAAGRSFLGSRLPVRRRMRRIQFQSQTEDTRCKGCWEKSFSACSRNRRGPGRQSGKGSSEEGEQGRLCGPPGVLARLCDALGGRRSGAWGPESWPFSEILLVGWGWGRQREEASVRSEAPRTELSPTAVLGVRVVPRTPRTRPWGGRAASRPGAVSRRLPALAQVPVVS